MTASPINAHQITGPFVPFTQVVSIARLSMSRLRGRAVRASVRDLTESWAFCCGLLEPEFCRASVTRGPDLSTVVTKMETGGRAPSAVRARYKRRFRSPADSLLNPSCALLTCFERTSSAESSHKTCRPLPPKRQAPKCSQRVIWTSTCKVRVRVLFHSTMGLPGDGRPSSKPSHVGGVSCWAGSGSACRSSLP